MEQHACSFRAQLDGETSSSVARNNFKRENLELKGRVEAGESSESCTKHYYCANKGRPGKWGRIWNNNFHSSSFLNVYPFVSVVFNWIEILDAFKRWQKIFLLLQMCFRSRVLRFNALMVNVIALPANFMFRNSRACSKDYTTVACHCCLHKQCREHLISCRLLVEHC